LEGFLFDHYWGKKSGLGSTGNARRAGFKTPPGVSPTNLFLSPGTEDPQTLRQGKVFEVIEVLGMHTANPVSGDFSVGVSGLWYQGASPNPVSGMALAGNVFDLFRRIEALGADLVFYGSLGAPTLLISEMDLSGG
jgi:PmbA protein